LDRDKIRKYVLTEEKLDDIGPRVERKPQKIFVTVSCSICYDRVINSRRQQKILKLNPYNIRAVQVLPFLLSFKENMCIEEIGKEEVVIAGGFQNR